MMNICNKYRPEIFSKIFGILFFAMLSFFSELGWGQIAAWDFTGDNTVATSTADVFDANLISSSGASDITRGSTAAASTGANSFRTTGFKNEGISTSNTDYFQITLTANTGYKVSLSTIDAKFAGTSTFYASPGVTSQFAYSLDGTNFTLIGSSVTSTSLTLTQIDLTGISALQNVAAGTTITIRYYASGQTTTGGWGFYSSTAGSYGLAVGGSVDVASSNSNSSNIIRNTGFPEPANIAYASYQEADLTSSSLVVAKFDIQDGGGSADADALSTSLTAITFSVSNVSNIQRLALYDGTTEISEIAAASPAVFTGLSSLSAADNGSKTFFVRASFNSTVTDNEQFQFTITSATADAAGSTFAAADAGGASSSTSGDANRIEVTATKLLFVQQPSNTGVNVAMSPNPTVKACDANENIDADYSTAVSVTSTGTLSGTPVSGTWLSGVATFASLTHTVIGTGLTLTATSSGITDATSNTFDISSSGSSIWENPITGTNPNASNPYTTGDVKNANITVSGIGRGSGIAGTNANDRYNAQGWSTSGIDLNDYFYFTLTPNSGYKINFTDFTYTAQVSSGTPSFAFRSSLDGYTANIGSPSATGTTIDLSGSSYQDITTAVTFRFYGYNFSASTTTFSINDFIFNGTVVPLGSSVVTAVSSSESATVSSIENTPSIIYNTEGTQVWQFDLYDGNGTDNDADALPTIYKKWTITQGASNTVTNWLQSIQSIKFFEDANASPIDGNLTINSTSIVFTPNTPISVADGAASKKRVSVRLSLKNPLPAGSDNKYFQFQLTNSNILTETSASSSQLNSLSLTSDGTKNKINVVKTKLIFKSAPSVVALSTNFSTTIAATDANGNTDLDATDNVTVAKYTGTGTVSSASGLTKALSSGVYTWTDVQYDVAEIFVLQVTASGLTTGYSNNILCVDAGDEATTLVNWDFPLTTDDQYADGGIALNYDAVTPTNSKYISLTGASGLVYTYPGPTTRCAYATGWNGGSGTKFWQIAFATTGYSQIKVSSKQKSSDSGPKNWKIQYKIGAGGTWTDVTGGSIIVDNTSTWILGVVSDLELPSACNEQASVYLRWIMTTNTSVDDETVLSTGSSRIDDIVITGISLSSLSTGTVSGSPFCITSSSGMAVDVPFTSVGSYNTGNVYTAQLSNSSGSFSNPVNIGTLTSTNNSGTINTTIPAAIASGTGYRIRVVSSDPVKTGSDNGENLIIVLNTPNVSNFNALASSGQVTLGWNNPVGCYDDVMIIGKASSSVIAVPAGDGSLYTDNLAFGASGTDANLPANEYCIYKGLTSGQIVTGLTNGVTYYFKIFVRFGSVWSNGVEISTVPSDAQAGDYKSTGTGGNWSSSATWLKFNGSTWAASGDAPDDQTKNVIITSGTTVILDAGGSPPFNVKDLKVENGAKLYCNAAPPTTNVYINLYGSNLICNGIIGNGSNADVIGFNIEGANVTISGTGTFDCNRIRKNYNSSTVAPNTSVDVTNLIIAMDINLRWASNSGTQIYNAIASYFNVTLNSGSTLNLFTSTGYEGNASINGTSGSGSGGGTWTINGAMNIPGIFYAKTSSTVRAAKWIIGNGGIVTCNYIECAASGSAGHEIEILDGGKLNLNTNNGFNNFSSTYNVYDFQDGSTVEYSSPSGTQYVKASIPGVFEYSNLLISTDGATKQMDGEVTVKRDLTITGGVLDPNGYDIYVGRNWDNHNTDGFLEGTTGTVYFNGTSAQSIYCPGGEDFYNIDFSEAGVKTIYDNVTAHNVTINSGSGAFNANDNDVSVSGNWSNYGTAGFTEGTVGSVTFNGSSAQSITCTGNEDFNKVIIDNSSTGVTLNNTINIADNILLDNGIVVTGANMVNVTNTSIDGVSGGLTSGTGKYIEGKLQWNTSSGYYTFPIGYNGYGAQGFDIQINTGNGNILSYLESNNSSPIYSYAFYDFETNDGDPANQTAGDGTCGPDGLLDKIEFNLSSPLQWNVTNPAGNGTVSNYDLTVYGNGSQDIISSCATTACGDKVKFLMKNGEPGNAGFATTSGSPLYSGTGFNISPSGGSTGINTLAGLTSFSKFTYDGATKANSILPIELLSFNAELNNDDVDLIWQTATEKNNDYFTIEKSRDGINFEKFADVDGAGNSNTILYYNSKDYDPFDGLTYYRLKQTDYDGKYSYSNIVSVYKNESTQINGLNINPQTNQLLLKVTTDSEMEILIKVIDVTGKMVVNENRMIDGQMQLYIPIKSLRAGLYVIHVLSTDYSYTQKVFVE